MPVRLRCYSHYITQEDLLGEIPLQTLTVFSGGRVVSLSDIGGGGWGGGVHGLTQTQRCCLAGCTTSTVRWRKSKNQREIRMMQRRGRALRSAEEGEMRAGVDALPSLDVE